jgi:pimeloyl-ACP methyl ester carboxylesterase
MSLPQQFIYSSGAPVFLYVFLFLTTLTRLTSGYAYPNPANNFSCQSAVHPNPVVLLHGLGATYYEDINELQTFLDSQSFCTFSLTYGAVEGFPQVGGYIPIQSSAPEIASFLNTVAQNTNAPAIDLVGHSEGAFQALYVPKFEPGIASLVDHIVAIAPPTHGTTFANLVAIMNGFDNGFDISLLSELVGTTCPACDGLTTPPNPVNSSSNDNLSDLVQSSAVLQLAYDTRSIAQPGTLVTIIASKDDELVTPQTTAFIEGEGEVANVWVQDFCSDDTAGHLDEAYDQNVWNIVLNALENDLDRPFDCVIDSAPAKRSFPVYS